MDGWLQVAVGIAIIVLQTTMLIAFRSGKVVGTQRDLEERVKQFVTIESMVNHLALRDQRLDEYNRRLDQAGQRSSDMADRVQSNLDKVWSELAKVREFYAKVWDVVQTADARDERLRREVADAEARVRHDAIDRMAPLITKLDGEKMDKHLHEEQLTEIKRRVTALEQDRGTPT